MEPHLEIVARKRGCFKCRTELQLPTFAGDLVHRNLVTGSSEWIESKYRSMQIVGTNHHPIIIAGSFRLHEE